MKKRYPFGVGILPEDVWGDAIKPSLSVLWCSEFPSTPNQIFGDR